MSVSKHKQNGGGLLGNMSELVVLIHVINTLSYISSGMCSALNMMHFYSEAEEGRLPSLALSASWEMAPAN